MTTSGSVFVRATFSKDSLETIKRLTVEATSEALDKARRRILALQTSSASQTPIDTGLLQSSFTVTLSFGQMFMEWSAMDKGFDYAKVQDVGRPNMVGRYYSDVLKMQAKEIVFEELVRALQMKLSAGA